MNLTQLFEKRYSCRKYTEEQIAREDLEYIDGRVYINNESATNKYIFGKVTQAKNVYSYPVK